MAAYKLESFGSKLEKMMTNLTEDSLEKLEAFLVDKICGNQMVNVGEFSSSLLLDETDIQLRAGLLELDATKWSEKAIRTACSKKAFGSLVVALESSGNQRIVQETYEWLQNPSKDPKSHSLDLGQAVATNPLALRKVFQHLSSVKLSAVARVNSFWKEEATSLLRKRDNLSYIIKSLGTCSAEAVKCLVKDIMRLVGPTGSAPYNGIFLDIDPHGPACSSPAVIIPNLEEILGTLSLKSLQVHLSANWLDHQNCPQFKLVQGLLQDLNGSLTDLQLKIKSGRDEFIQLVQQFNVSFTNVKILRLEEDDDIAIRAADEGYKNYITALVSLAPNLQQLHLRGYVDLAENFLGERQPEVLLYQGIAFAPFIAQSLMGSLKLERLSFRYCSGLHAEAFQRFLTILPVLLDSCCSGTLTDLYFNPLIALSLMSQGVVLENVERLSLGIDYVILQRLEPRILQNFNKFHFKRIFPKLRTVFIRPLPIESQPLPDHVEQLIEAVADFSARPDGAADSIICLHLIGGLSDPTFDFVLELFPCIEILVVKDALGEASISFGSIWKQNWTNMETLHIEANMASFAQEDLDSVFCGIFPEEVAELRKQTDEYLKSVNIVPIKPSFARLKDLSSFTLKYCDDVNVGPASILSKVTGLIAFAKLPTLAVTLGTKRPDFYDALEHMKPFASVVLKKATYRSSNPIDSCLDDSV